MVSNEVFVSYAVYTLQVGNNNNIFLTTIVRLLTHCFFFYILREGSEQFRKAAGIAGKEGGVLADVCVDITDLCPTQNLWIGP